MAEQEHAAEEARRAGLARLRAARTHSERSQAREMVQKDQAGETSATAEGDTQESVEEATDEAVEEGADGEIAQEDASASGDDEAAAEQEEAADEAEEAETKRRKMKMRSRNKLLKGLEGTAKGKKRRVSDVEEEGLTQVSAFKAQHDSWASLELCLKEYMEPTRQKIVVKEVVNVGRKRTSHKLNTTDCPFQMLAQVTKRRDGSWGIVMKCEVYCHNHRVSEDIYRSYPGIRQVPANSRLMSGIELLVEAQAGTTTQMKHATTNSTYSRTEENYHMHRNEFKSLACQDNRTELWEYFDKNWNECCEMWVMAYWVDLPHFGNHTNNRVESLLGKLEWHLKGHFTMRASLKVLLDYHQHKEEQYRSNVEMPGTLRDVSYSEELKVALG
ncbi:hypothetical protein GQ600_13752 [Phytophthora cactorum]|nr:hypothetical protein GQ600_13752 [Phytophthora cactorum]